MATWIFGYGSLIWKPNLPYVNARWGWVHGWERRLWQASPDHRGTPEAPGRVWTLVPISGGRCIGKAFLVDPRYEGEVLEQLNFREQAGYTRQPIKVHHDDNNFTEAHCYIGLEDNPWFLGPASFEDILQQVRTAKGPSGSNSEYVLRLAQALRGHTRPGEDAFLFELESALNS